MNFLVVSRSTAVFITIVWSSSTLESLNSLLSLNSIDYIALVNLLTHSFQRTSNRNGTAYRWQTLFAKISHWDSPFPFLLVRFKRFLYCLISPLCTVQRTRGCRASMGKFKIHGRLNPLFEDALCERLSSHFLQRIYRKLPNLGHSGCQAGTRRM